MDDESTNEILMGALAVFICGVILLAVIKFYPNIMDFFNQFSQNRHGNF